MLREKISKNLKLKYWLKGIQRKKIIYKMSRKNINQLMQYDAELYEKRCGKLLDWNNLQSYTEKMQWEKLFDHDPKKITCTDKYAVRDWVAEMIGEEYLIPLLGVWDDANDIDFDSLPNQFVLKTNCSSGDVIIIRDKSVLTKKDIAGYRAKLKYYLKMKFGYNTCELHYNDIKPKIVAEKLMSLSGKNLLDYKFFCFDGVPYFCWVDVGRYTQHRRRNFYDLNWNLQHWKQSYDNTEKEIDKPINFDKMIDIATKLSKGFSHVRVDLYNIDGKIYFGEMTFTSCSGFELIEPESANLMLGKLWNLNTELK